MSLILIDFILNFFLGKHERMHMISSNQSNTNAPISNFLNEKLCKINLLKRKNDFSSNEVNDFNDYKVNKYQKTSISSSLSPSSTSSTLSLTVAESNNSKHGSSLSSNLDSSNLISNNNHVLEFILKNTNNSNNINENKIVSDECKENRYNAIEKPAVEIKSKHNEVSHSQIFTNQAITYLPHSQSSPFYLNKPFPSAEKNITEDKRNVSTPIETIYNDSFPQNKYKKFLSNFNQQKNVNTISHNETETVQRKLDEASAQLKLCKQVVMDKQNQSSENQNNKRVLENDKYLRKFLIQCMYIGAAFSCP